jgi:hypothetical protein
MVARKTRNLGIAMPVGLQIKVVCFNVIGDAVADSI